MTFTKTVLENGLRIITSPQKDNPAVTVLILVETGSEYESKDKNGISHFLEHMCFKGTKNRPKAIDISIELDSVGAEYNAFTDHQCTGYFAKVDKSHFDRALDVVSDIFLNQIFDPKEIEKERGPVIEEINLGEDTPTTNIYRVFPELLYGDQPAGWNILGPKEVIRKIGREDFVEYRKDHCVARATTVAVAGSIDEKEVVEKIKKAFANISTAEKKAKPILTENQSEPGLLVKNKKSDQSHIMLGVRAYNLFDERRYILEVLADVLGGGMSSRLFQNIRGEMGAAYYVHALTYLLTDHGYLAARAGLGNDKLLDAVKAILGEFKRLKVEKVNEAELKKAKDHMVGSLMLSLETSDSLASFYGFQELLAREVLTPEEEVRNIQKVSAEEVQEVANDIFTDDKLNLAVIGPVGEEKDLKQALKIA